MLDVLVDVLLDALGALIRHPSKPTETSDERHGAEPRADSAGQAKAPSSRDDRRRGRKDDDQKGGIDVLRVGP